MRQTGSVMERGDLKEIIDRAVRDAVGSTALDHVDVTEGLDHDGEPALFVTVRYRAGIDTVDQAAALGSVRDRLQAIGENRFPYMNHIYPDDLLAEDDEPNDAWSAS